MLPIIYLVAAIIGLVAFIAGPLLASIRAIPPLAGFGLFGLGCAIGTIVTLIGIGVILKKGPPTAHIAAALGVVPCIVLIYAIATGGKYPPINDITTETIYPPPFEHLAALPENNDINYEFPKDNAPIIKEHYPDISPIALEGDAEDILHRASELARNQKGWEVVHSRIGTTESFIEGYATSSMFRFRDDFVIRITKTETGAVIDMRSRSRDGKSDLGANAARIQKFLAALQ